jgi:hypothetical protein
MAGFKKFIWRDGALILTTIVGWWLLAAGRNTGCFSGGSGRALRLGAA